ncbi:extensin family protein [Nitratireductor soli]|uniref:extensin-like domain-containing protein n=1 Tax=Nitratireductor soli TaxID=1670619 RepID=UPI00065E5FCE|nr:extensin family protein [Nitratireductor soli]
MTDHHLASRLIGPAILATLLAAIPLAAHAGQGQHRSGELPAHPPVPTLRGELRQSELSVPVPIPTPRPERPKEPPEAEPKPPAPGKSTGLPKRERTCRAALTALGIDFTDKAPIAEADGCAIPHPIIIRRLSRTIALEPEALVNCRTALALARFFVDQAPSLAKRHLGQALHSVHHASAYVCRPRRGTQKLSEHAFGNAFDIGVFTLTDGTQVPVEVQKDPNGKAAKFLDAFRAAACGPFKTVLGPGSDADHGDHFHLDMKARRNDHAFCR